MMPVIFLRIASVLTLVHAVLHTIGGVFGSNQFLLMGHMRTFWDFYHGMGLGVSISLTAEGIVLWQLGSLAKTDAARLRPVMATFMLAYVALAVNSNTYFFMGPVIAEILIALCLGGAIVTAGFSVVARETQRIHA